MKLADRVDGAYIGGSGTWGIHFPEDLGFDVEEVLAIETPWGTSAPFKVWELDGHTLLRFSFHGAQGYLEGQRSLPLWVTSLQVGYILNRLECPWALIDASVGGIQNLDGGSLPPRSYVVPHDVYLQDPDKLAEVDGELISFMGECEKVALMKNNGERGVLRLRHPLHPDLRQAILAAAQWHEDQVPAVLERGKYIQPTIGTFAFETPSEIEAYARWGFNVVGKTLGYEVMAMAAWRIPIAHLSMVANHAEGRDEHWNSETMSHFYETCGRLTGKIMIEALRNALKLGEVPIMTLPEERGNYPVE